MMMIKKEKSPHFLTISHYTNQAFSIDFYAFILLMDSVILEDFTFSGIWGNLGFCSIHTCIAGLCIVTISADVCVGGVRNVSGVRQHNTQITNYCSVTVRQSEENEKIASRMICSTPVLVLPQYHVKEHGHCAKSTGGWLQLNCKHAYKYTLSLSTCTSMTYNSWSHTYRTRSIDH